ncbi:MAG: flagellar basal-body MS-ring/collar protein FliF [Wenzhouxiangella sp.]
MAAQNPVQSNSPLALLDTVPGLRQLVLLIGLAAAVAAGVGIVLWSHEGGERVLFSNLTERDAAEVVGALDTSQIPYTYESGSGVVTVPSDQVHSARLMLAAEGLPRGAGVGLEMLHESESMTNSQFMESARYQRSLEIELQRTIASISSISGARVHLAIPRQTVFVRERTPASASVLLEMHQGRRLEPGQVEAIINLVASSVPDMERSQISVIDQQGTLLSADRARGEDAAANGADRLVHRLEERLASRVEDLLSPMVGMGRVRAQVAVDMDFTSTQETQEVYDPANPVLRSEQSTEEIRSIVDPARGVPGALANQPLLEDLAGVLDEEDEQASVPLSRQNLRNFEISRTIRNIQSGPGAVERLSVAVVLDEPTTEADGETQPDPYSDEEIERLTSLVQEVVGFDAERGDSVSVVQAPFRALELADTGDFESPGLLDGVDFMGIFRIMASVVMVLLLILLVVRPLMKSLSAPPPLRTLSLPGAGQGPAQASLPPAQQGYGGDTGAGGRSRANYEERLSTARSVASQDPKRVASVVKQWVNEGG